jgi:hypothetical protein
LNPAVPPQAQNEKTLFKVFSEAFLLRFCKHLFTQFVNLGKGERAVLHKKHNID